MNLFEKHILYHEAPGDEGGAPSPPDAAEPPAVPEPPAAEEMVDSPPNIDDDPPPDIPEEGGGGGVGEEDPFGGEGDMEQPEELEALDVNEKLSAVLNKKLYDKMLRLNDNIQNTIDNIKQNNDIIYSASEETAPVVKALVLLKENLGLYLENVFIHENYSKNVLFYNKCINQLKMLMELFEKHLRKSLKDRE